MTEITNVQGKETWLEFKSERVEVSGEREAEWELGGRERESRGEGAGEQG